MANTVLNPDIERHIQSAATVCRYLWERGWAERNGGNVSVNLVDCVPKGQTIKASAPMIPDQRLPRSLAGGLFFFTGTGRRLRDVAESPETHACVLRINDSGDGYQILWGGGNNPSFRPTSELIPHLNIHRRLVEIKSPHRAIVHTHAIELLCLTHHPKYIQDQIGRASCRERV